MSRWDNPRRQCMGKLPFPTEAEAEAYASWRRGVCGLAIRAYLCPHCRKYHVGRAGKHQVWTRHGRDSA